MTDNVFLNKLLDYYQISYEDYLLLNRDVDMNSFASSFHFDKEKEAKDLIMSHISKKNKIIIYGDFDADGIMGTSILVRMFQLLNYKVDYYIPSRYIEGYGIGLNKVKEYVEKGYNLLITVDNGIAANEEIDYLRKNNVDVIVIDHHLNNGVLPNANYIIHPIISHFNHETTSGAATSFYFSKVVLGYYDKYSSILAAISVVTDLMPLKGYNRDLLRIVFKNYINNEFPAISLIADYKMLDENVIGLTIGPRINSYGRLLEDDSINDLVKYFTSDNRDFQLNYIDTILDINEKRRESWKNTLENFDLNNVSSSIIMKTNLKVGVVGLLATYFVNTYHVPAIVFAQEKEGLLKGSSRSPEGFNLVDSYQKLKDYIVDFGGHSSAAGVMIKNEDFEKFKTNFEEISMGFVYKNEKKAIR